MKVLEVGCGTASNLCFAAEEGFDVYGIDASPSAIQTARVRFATRTVHGELIVGDFTHLPYSNTNFDLVIDRYALSCCGSSAMKLAVAEVARVLKPGGKFLFTPASDTDTSAQGGDAGADDAIVDIQRGTKTGVGQIRFLSHVELAQVLPAKDWDINSLELVETKCLIGRSPGSTDAHWRVVARRRT